MISNAQISPSRLNRRVPGFLGGGGGTDPYVWYNALDKSTIPFHAGSGFWGAQSTVKEAAAPTGTMTNVNVANASQLAAVIYTPNQRITLTGDVTGGVFNNGNITDVDIIIPPGRLMKDCVFGSFSNDYTISRLRFRGNTVGATGTGGQIHNLFIYSTVQDLIIEGVDMSATGSASDALCIQKIGARVATRVALHNVRASTGGTFYTGDADDMTVCGCSILTGRSTVSPAEAWAFRFSYHTEKNVVFYANDIRSDTVRSSLAYHRVRWHPNDNLDYVWVNGNRFVERVEGRVLWVHSGAGNSNIDGGDMASFWFDTNEVIATNGASVECYDCEHARIVNNTFKSNTITSSANINLTYGGGSEASSTIDGVKTPNTYQSLPGSDPAWAGAGDPSSITWNL